MTKNTIDTRKFALQCAIDVFKQPQFTLQVNTTNMIGLAAQFADFLDNGVQFTSPEKVEKLPIEEETVQTELAV